ncbi:MAG: hypothetical protein JWQ38_283 [Flavipsychrobacter sp.]|nr:hypothetical protein [Flavipsychrobacter sp.]
MNRKILLFAILLLSVTNAIAQSTDPMIINWWFNTTGAKYKAILTDVEAVYYTTSTVYVKASGIPNYYADGVTHNDGKDLKATWAIPRVPVKATTPKGVMGGQMGLMLDGSVFFHPGDAQSYMSAGIWNRLAYYFEGVDMDASNGHSTPDNMYHHHFDNLKLHDFVATKHSPIVAYAWDGYPVYGPYGYKNTDGTGGITRMVTSYSTKSYTTRTSGPATTDPAYPIGCFIEDWQYNAGSGDLDEHNGRFCVTPEYPSGTYAYFTTVDASLKPIYPYFIGPTFYGNFDMSVTGPSGGSSVIPTGATKYNPSTTQVNEIAVIEANISLYPIPVVTDLNIQLKEDKDYTVVIYNMNGAILENKKISSSSKISMANLPYGVYFVEVTDASNNSGFIKRIVKQ